MRTFRHKSRTRQGFTIIELLVVISIIGMLSSVILVSLQSARDKGTLGAAIKFSTYNYRAFGANAALIYLFNNGAEDTSGNGFNGSANNLSDRTSYNNSNAYYFSGNSNLGSESMIQTNGFKFNTNNGITISFWIKMSSANSGSIIKATKSNTVNPFGNNNNNPFNLYIVQGNVSFYDKLNADDTMVTSNKKINDDKWHNVTVVVASPNSNNGFARVYIDGKLDSQGITYDPNTFNYPDSYNTPMYLWTGANAVGGSAFLNAILDDVMLFNEPISLSRIQDIYLAGLPEHSVAQR